jgi:hypothetical protein
MSTFSEWMAGLRGRDYPHPQAITEVFGGLPRDCHPQAITEDIGGLPNESRTVTYMGRELEIPHPNHWSREYVEQRTQEIEEAANRYAEGLAERRREAEARAMHHMWHPSDNECNINVLPRWSFERERQLDFDPATGEITNSGGTLPNEEVLFDPGTLVDTSENNQLTTISSIEPAWELSVSDAMTDKYKEMEKRVEEQDKTIAEMKSIIENLQDIVYQRKLDKEAETLVL